MTCPRISNSSHDDGQGCLGALVRERAGAGRVLAVTAAHVLATHPGAALDDEIDIEPAPGATPLRARLCDWLPRFGSSGECDVEAALATLAAPAWRALAATPALLPTGVAQPAVNAHVSLRGPRGNVDGTLLGYVSCWVRSGQQYQHRYQLTDMLCYQLDSSSDHGWSGAPVWDRHDRLVAIHIGATPPGTAGNALGVPIQRILNRWAVDLVCRGDPAPVQPLLASRDRVVAAGEAAPSTAAAIAGDGRDVLIRTVWGEARGEPVQGMAAVAHVVLNRVRAQRYWGKTVSEVCLKPYQFSCWNANDPNRPQMLRLDITDARWRQLVGAVDQALAEHGQDPQRSATDPTQGATHYHNRWMARPPRWVQGRLPCCVIGKHAFYKNID